MKISEFFFMFFVVIFLAFLFVINSFVSVSYNGINPLDTSRYSTVLWHSYRVKEDFTGLRKFFRKEISYKITFIGKYHIWPKFKEGSGIDALLFQDVPVYSSGIQNLDSSSQSFVDKLFAEKIPLSSKKLIKIPSPFIDGSDSLYFIPSYHQGLRINERTVDSYDLVYKDTTEHIYQILIKGDDRNYEFKFLNNFYVNDSLVSGSEYLKGDFQLFIRNILSSDTCRTLIKSKGKYIELQIDFAELIVDTTYLRGIRNLLKTKSVEEQRRRFALRSEQRFYCIDSIECKSPNKNKNLLILVDRSNTMDQVVGSGNKKKIEIEKQSITNFILNGLNPEDSVALITFNTEYELVPWTNEKSLIIDKISNLEPKGNTLLYKYILKSLEYLNSYPRKNKALIVFTDGINQPPFFDSMSTFEYIISRIWKYSSIPIYFVVIPSNPSPDRNIGLKRLWELKSTHSNSIIYTPGNISDLDKDINKILEDYSYNLCCSISLLIPNPCLGKTQEEIVFVDLIYSPIEKDTILNFKIPITCNSILKNALLSCLVINQTESYFDKEKNFFISNFNFSNVGYLPIVIYGVSQKKGNIGTSENFPIYIEPFGVKQIKFFSPLVNSFDSDTIEIFKNTNCGDSIIVLELVSDLKETKAGFNQFVPAKDSDSDFFFISIFPNPIEKKDILSVNLNATKEETVFLKIYDFKGELVNSLDYFPSYSGIHVIKFNVENFACGIYFLLIIRSGRYDLKSFTIIP